MLKLAVRWSGFLFFAWTALVVGAVTDFQAVGDVTVEGVNFSSGTVDLVISSGSTAESIEFSAGEFFVTNPGTFSFSAASSGVASLRAEREASVVACEENVDPGTTALTLPLTAGLYELIPSSLGCESEEEESVATTTPERDKPGLPVRVISPVWRSIATAPSGQPGGVSAPTRRLVVGSIGDDVRQLQVILNRDPRTRVAVAGPGSPGQETTVYGGLTRAAVIRFQEQYGIVAGPTTPGYGEVGPLTRAKIAELSVPAATEEPETRLNLLQTYVRLLEEYVRLQQALQQ